MNDLVGASNRNKTTTFKVVFLMRQFRAWMMPLVTDPVELHRLITIGLNDMYQNISRYPPMQWHPRLLDERTWSRLCICDVIICSVQLGLLVDFNNSFISFLKKNIVTNDWGYTTVIVRSA